MEKIIGTHKKGARVPLIRLTEYLRKSSLNALLHSLALALAFFQRLCALSTRSPCHVCYGMVILCPHRTSPDPHVMVPACFVVSRLRTSHGTGCCTFASEHT